MTLLGAAARLVARRAGRWGPSWSAKASRELTLAVPRAQALERARRALEALDLVEAPEVDGESVTATTRATWRTFGNRVTVRVRETERGETLVTVSSRPTRPQKFDWGTSRSLVDAVVSRLRI
jgi:hypothetical protein